MVMKAKWSIAVALFIVLLSGCGFSRTPALPGQPREQQQEKAHNIIPVNIVQWAEVPELLRRNSERLRQFAGFTTWEEGGQNFVLIHAGKKPTGGYNIEVARVEDNDPNYTVLVKWIKPQPGETVLQATTYPRVVIKIPAGKKIRVKDLAGREVAPFANIIVFADSLVIKDRLTVSGLARVFEATVSARLLDSQGKVLLETHTMASSGAPDWGIFNFDLPVDRSKLQDKSGILKIYWNSPKDGAELDTVEIPIKFE